MGDDKRGDPLAFLKTRYKGVFSKSVLQIEVPNPYTLHSTPYALHSTPYTLHSTPDTLTLHPTPCTLHPTLSTLHVRQLEVSPNLTVNFTILFTLPSLPLLLVSADRYD